MRDPLSRHLPIHAKTPRIKQKALCAPFFACLAFFGRNHTRIHAKTPRTKQKALCGAFAFFARNHYWDSRQDAKG